MRKKNGAGGINLLTSDYTTKLQSPRQYSTGTKAEIQTKTEQDRTPRDKSHTHCQLIFDKVGKNMQWRKDSLLSKWCSESWTTAYKSIKLECTLTSYIKIKSKWLKDLNIKQDTIKFLREHTQSILCHKLYQYFLRAVFQNNRNISKNEKMGQNQAYKLLYSKGNHK